jgi:hypothetical protein
MAGSTVTTLGMRLLSLMGVGSSTRQDTACMLVLGMGIGVSCRCWSSLRFSQRLSAEVRLTKCTSSRVQYPAADGGSWVILS